MLNLAKAFGHITVVLGFLILGMTAFVLLGVILAEDDSDAAFLAVGSSLVTGVLLVTFGAVVAAWAERELGIRAAYARARQPNHTQKVDTQ